MGVFENGEEALQKEPTPFFHGVNPELRNATGGTQYATGALTDFFELNQDGTQHLAGPARFGLVFNLGGVLGKSAWAFEYRDAAGTFTGRFMKCEELVDGNPLEAGNVWVPVAGGSLPVFNGARPITRSGQFYGLNVGGTDVAQFVANVFFPAEPPAVGLSAANPVRRFGADPAVVLSYAVQAVTNPITAIHIGAAAQAVIQTGTGTYATATAANTDTNFSVTVETGTETATAGAYVVYRNERVAFVSNADLFALSDFALSTAIRAEPLEFATGRQQSASYTPNAEFIYWFWPAAFGSGAFVQNGLPNTAFVTHDFTFTNAEGFAQLGRLTRSQSLQSGTQSVAVN